jgi:hypothetical protein
MAEIKKTEIIADDPKADDSNKLLSMLWDFTDDFNFKKHIIQMTLNLEKEFALVYKKNI